MSTTGSSGVPPGGGAGDRPLPQSLAELKAKVIELRGEMKVQQAREKMAGEILRNNPDGTTVIKTPKGEITVALRLREPLPPGTRVEVEVPPGAPPRQVTVRPAQEQAEPARQAPPPAQPTPRETDAPAPPPAAETPARSSSTPPADPRPASPEAQPRPAPLATPAPPPPPRLDIRTAEDLAKALPSLPKDAQVPVTLKPQDVIRLLALPTGQAAPPPANPVEQHQATPLPQQPRAALADALFAQASPALRITPAEPLLLLHDLPQTLPVLTQGTRDPFAGFDIPAAARPSYTAAQSFLQQVLQVNQPAALAAAPPFSVPAPSALTPGLVLAAPGIATPEGALSPTLAPVLASGLPAPAGGVPLTSSGALTPSLLDVRVNTIMPPAVQFVPVPLPGAAPAQPAAAPAIPQPQGASVPQLPGGFAGQLSGTVAGFTPQNFPILSVSFPAGEGAQNFILQFPAANLPQGARVDVTPLPGASGGAAQTLAPFIPFAFFSDSSWPAMEELSRTLQQAAPQLAQALSNVSANAAAPTRMPMAALFFIAAMRSGDVSGWLGDRAVDALRRVGKGELLNRLTRDAGGLQRTETQPPGEWRATALPLFWDGELSKLMLYYRHDERSDSDSEDKKRGTRFIFDLNLNRLGEVQLDGLHRKDRLDLIVRTTERLSPSMQQTMRRRYVEVMEQTDLAGELSFQNRAEQFVKVDMPKKSPDG